MQPNPLNALADGRRLRRQAQPAAAPGMQAAPAAAVPQEPMPGIPAAPVAAEPQAGQPMMPTAPAADWDPWREPPDESHGTSNQAAGAASTTPTTSSKAAEAAAASTWQESRVGWEGKSCDGSAGQWEPKDPQKWYNYATGKYGYEEDQPSTRPQDENGRNDDVGPVAASSAGGVPGDTEGAGAAPSADAEAAEPNASTSRLCNECQEMKPLTAFYNRMKKDGLQHRLCRVCFDKKNASPTEILCWECKKMVPSGNFFNNWTDWVQPVCQTCCAWHDYNTQHEIYCSVCECSKMFYFFPAERRIEAGIPYTWKRATCVKCLKTQGVNINKTSPQWRPVNREAPPTAPNGTMNSTIQEALDEVNKALQHMMTLKTRLESALHASSAP